MSKTFRWDDINLSILIKIMSLIWLGHATTLKFVGKIYHSFEYNKIWRIILCSYTQMIFNYYKKIADMFVKDIKNSDFYI
jgi:hypothetical protein